MPSEPEVGTLYLLHFDKIVSDTAQHYLGFTMRTPEERLVDHRTGRGAKLTRYAAQCNVKMEIVWTVLGTRADERRLKNRSNHRSICPLCRVEFLKRKSAQKRTRKASRKLQPTTVEEYPL